MVRGLLLAATLLVGACAHDDLVVTDRDGPAPPRIGRAADLRRHVRAIHREARRSPHEPMQLLPSGLPEIQRPAPPTATIQAHGDHLLLLRGDHLLVVSLRDRTIVAREPLGHAFNSSLLLHADDVIVVLPEVPFNDRRDRVELRRYTIAADGRLTRRDSVRLRGGHSHLPSEFQIVGDALVGLLQGPADHLPAIRRAGRWKPLIRPRDLQRPIQPATEAMTRVRCTLGDTIDCTAIGIVAPSTFYVLSDDQSYVAWSARGGITRLPFADLPISTVRVDGRPLDLMSWRLGHGDLDAVVRTPGTLTAVHIPAATLRAGLATLASSGHKLPIPDDEVATRFIGHHLLHGDTPDWACRGPSTLHIRSLTDPTATTLGLPHCISRIEPLGEHALVFGAKHSDPTADVHLTTIDLRTLTVADARTVPQAQPLRVRADGPLRLGGSLLALPPKHRAATPLFTHTGPRLQDLGGVPGEGHALFAVHHAGRMFLVRDDPFDEVAELVELAVRDHSLSIIGRLALQ